MDRCDIIQQIVTYHPAFNAGRSRDWSYWQGGMTGRGDWYYLKLVFATWGELYTCLQELIKENEGIDYRFNEAYIKT
jgi:hypothetical protein